MLGDLEQKQWTKHDSRYKRDTVPRVVTALVTEMGRQLAFDYSVCPYTLISIMANSQDDVHFHLTMLVSILRTNNGGSGPFSVFIGMPAKNIYWAGKKYPVGDSRDIAELGPHYLTWNS